MRTSTALTIVLVLLAGAVHASEKVNPLPTGFTEVECPAGPGSSGPFLHRTDGGVVTLSWVEPTTEGHRLRFAAWRDSLWGEPITVAEGTDWFVNWADVPSVIADGHGRMAAHWLEKTGDDTYAYGVRVSQSFDGGKTWSDPITPHRDGTDTEHGFASLIFYNDYLHLVWLDGRKYADEAQPDEMTLRAARIDRDGNLSGEAELDGRTCDCCPTAVAPIEGGFIVAYRDRSPEEIRDIAVTRYLDGKWETPRIVAADNWQINGCPVNGPAVASDGKNVALAWFTMRGAEALIRGVWSADGGGTFGDAMEIADEDPVGRVSVAGMANVAWVSQTDDGARIVRRWMGDGTVTQAARTLAYTNASRSSGYPRIATVADEQPGLLVVWTESGDTTRIRSGIVVETGMEELRDN